MLDSLESERGFKRPSPLCERAHTHAEQRCNPDAEDATKRDGRFSGIRALAVTLARSADRGEQDHNVRVCVQEREREGAQKSQ